MQRIRMYTVSYTVQFKLYPTKHANNDKLYSSTTHDSHQATMKSVTSTEADDSNGS